MIFKRIPEPLPEVSAIFPQTDGGKKRERIVAAQREIFAVLGSATVLDDRLVQSKPYRALVTLVARRGHDRGETLLALSLLVSAGYVRLDFTNAVTAHIQLN